MVTRTHTLLSLHCGEHSLLWTQCVLVLFRIFQTLLRPTNKINVKRKERREWRETYINLQVSFNEAAAIRWSLHALLLYFFFIQVVLGTFWIVWYGTVFYTTQTSNSPSAIYLREKEGYLNWKWKTATMMIYFELSNATHIGAIWVRTPKRLLQENVTLCSSLSYGLAWTKI